MTHLETLRAAGMAISAPDALNDGDSAYLLESVVYAIEAAEKLEALVAKWERTKGSGESPFGRGIGQAAAELRSIIGLAD